ncbi:tape measure protein [Salmonella enterica]|nr:tape measure protein [Salmonella enterica]
MSDEKVGGIYYTVEAKTAALLEAQRAVDTSTASMQAGFNKTDKSVNSLNQSFAKLSSVASAVMTALSASLISQYANAWTELSNKLVNSIRDHETLADVTGRVFKIAQESRSELDATATLYGRLEKSTRSYNVSADELAQLTATINKSFVVSGASAEEAARAIRQLAQGMGTGALRGDEFISVMEGSPRLAQALADSLGVDIGQLKAMAGQGKITTKVIVDGLLKQGVVIAQEFEKTTQTMGQSFTVATNNVTKFVGESTTVQSTISAIGSAVVTVSENMDVLAVALAGVATIMGGRYISALTLSAGQSLKKAVADRAMAVAEKEAATAAQYAANAVLRKAVADKEAAASATALAQAEYNLARGTETEAAALDNLIAKRSAETAATANAVEAKNALTAATTRANAAARAASVGINLAKNALALIGGPAGAAMLAASAIYYFYQKAQEARDEANKLADSVNDLGAKFQAMSNTELSASIAKLRTQIPELTDAVSDARKANDDAALSVQRLERELSMYGGRADSAKKITEKLNSAKNTLSITTYDLEKAENRLSAVQNTVSMGQATLNGTMKQGIDLLRRDGEQAGVAAGMMNRLGQALDFASQSKEKFNSSSLNVERSADADKLLKQLQDENALLAINDKRQRAVADARQKALAAGAQENSNQLRQIEEEAALRYDQIEAERQKNQISKSSTKIESQAEQAEKQRQKTLQDLNNEMAVATLTAKGMEKEAAQLAAEQKLGAGATEAQIQQVREYAAVTWEAANAIKAKQAAEQGVQFANQEIATAKTQVDATTGKVADPFALINLQEQQKLATLDQYRTLDVEHAQLYEDAKTAIQQQAATERQAIMDSEGQAQQQAISNILSVSAQGFDAMAGLVSSFASESSGAYRALFGISKGFAVAQASLNLYTAISNALALPFPQNIPAMAKAVAAGGQVVQAVSGINYSGGRRYGGGVSAGNAYRVNENGQSEVFQNSAGQQTFIPNQSGKIIPANEASGGSPVNVVINNTSSTATVENQGYNPDTRTIMLAVKEVAKQLRNRNGEVARSLGDSWNISGKTR